MKRTYEVRDRADKRAIREFLKREGQFLLPMLELVEQTEVVIDEVIQVMGRATIEAVLEMSAEGVAGVKQAGRSRAEDDTVWYGRQGGVVYLSDRKVRVERPRLRRRGAGEGGEVEVPAYAAMRRPGAVADRMLEVLMAGVSTRKYGRVIGEMADTVGVSKSAVSRETVEASERVLKELMERRLDAWDLLVIYLDGIQMGSHHVLAAVGVDSDGKKHVLGVREGASENAEVTSALLEDLVERGLDPGRRRLFVIDGSQRQIYQVLSETAAETGSQVIAASHSEVILNEAAGRDTVVAFVGTPHRIDYRGSQVLKALKEIGFEHYIQAEEVGWVLFLEGSTDLAILRAFAEKLDHPAGRVLERPFVHYVGNQPTKARAHFYGLREAKHDLRGLALYDRLDKTPPADPNLRQETWHRREIENYICQKSTLLAWAEAQGRVQHGDLFACSWRDAMERSVEEVRSALSALNKPDPWSPDLKASQEFLEPLFKKFYAALKLPNLMQKTDYHTLAPHVSPDQLDAEVGEKLDAIATVARSKKEGSSNSCMTPYPLSRMDRASQESD